MQRFINRDPIGEAGGFNLYAHVESEPLNRWDFLGLKECVGDARVLKGNSALIGKQGGISIVKSGSAAVDPAQWGGKSKLKSNSAASKISGKFTDQSGKQVGSFSGITDVIGGKSPIKGVPVRDALKQLYPGKLIIELPSADDDLGTVKATITVPDDFPCPDGTKPK